MLQGKLLNEVPFNFDFAQMENSREQTQKQNSWLTYLTINSKRTTFEQQAAKTRKMGTEGCICAKKKKKERGGTANAKAANGAVHDARVIRRCIMGACIFISCKRKGSDVTCCYESQWVQQKLWPACTVHTYCINMADQSNLRGTFQLKFSPGDWRNIPLSWRNNG